MSGVPHHPMIIHLPLILALVMPLLAIGAVIGWWRGWLGRQSWLLIVGLQAILVASALAAVQTGVTDGQVVSRRVPEAPLDAHQQLGGWFFYASAIVFVLAGLTVMMPGRRRALGLAGVAAATTLVVAWLGYRTGETGGRLVYQHGAGEAFPASPPDAGLAPPRE